MINAFCYCLGDTTWALHATQFLRALNRLREVALVPLDGNGRSRAHPDEMLRMLENGRHPAPHAPSLGIGPIDVMTRLRGPRSIAFVVWETTVIPEQKVRILKAVDEVWTPSEWGRRLLVANGVDPERARVVPEGVDAGVFRPAPSRPCDGRPFRFLCVGKWEERKATSELVRAFCEEFQPDEPVELVLHCWNPWMPGFGLEASIRRAARGPHAPILASHPVADEALAGIYQAADAFVLPTRAEGWGLPITEAMACGLPVIVTDYSAPAEYVHDGVGYPIRVASMVDVSDPWFFPAGLGLGQWAQPDFAHLRAVMRHVYEHPEEAAETGRRAREEICARWTWDHAAEKACAILDDPPKRVPAGQPALPRLQSVEIIGPFRGTSGHDRHTRELVRHLAALHVRVQLTNLNGWSVPLSANVREGWFDTLGAPVDARVALHFAMPPHCRPRGGKINVNYTMFEADRIPRAWVALARDHACIVVPELSSARAWIDSGVPESKVRISPLGVDGEYFGTPVEPLPLTLPDGRAVSSFSVRILNVAELRPRKNHIGLVRAWLRATHRDDDAVLILKCTAFQSRALDLLRDDLQDMQRTLGRSLAGAAPILMLTALLPDEQMRALYQSATHYVSMSFGEGWDLAMMESAAAGLALIAPRHTAYVSYLTDEDAELIDARCVPAGFEGRVGVEDRVFFDGANWWRPDEDAAVATLSRIIRAGQPAKPSPRERIVRDYSWQRAATRLVEVLEEVAGEIHSSHS
jgi:glycosyltransferase involved in cell wall biosynthesis